MLLAREVFGHNYREFAWCCLVFAYWNLEFPSLFNPLFGRMFSPCDTFLSFSEFVQGKRLLLFGILVHMTDFRQLNQYGQVSMVWFQSGSNAMVSGSDPVRSVKTWQSIFTVFHYSPTLFLTDRITEKHLKNLVISSMVRLYVSLMF